MILMNKPIIEVTNLSKKYTLGERQPYYSFRDTISSILRTPFRKEKLQRDEFWALKDISFNVKEGDVVGVIGRNGAGKSTLLKILSQITPPTEGEISLRGRVASLLEVGTGFHPELTGRENIFLNGAILGMKRWEINNKFKDIVEFSEIEKFLDTPVKHYSSGMYMRLAFAIAAHLEPEILIVDEVLAVGDTQFQKKCLGKMDDISKKDGRTVLFVSHNMEAVKQLCSRTILLNNGQLEKIGNTNDVIEEYLKDTTQKIVPLSERKDRKGDGKIFFTKIETATDNRNKKYIFTGKPFSIKLYYKLSAGIRIIKNLAISLTVNDLLGNHLLAFWTETSGSNFVIDKKEGIIECKIDYCPLLFGQYYINIYSTVNGVESDYLIKAETITVDDQEYFKNGRRDDEKHPKYVVNHHWESL